MVVKSAEVDNAEAVVVIEGEDDSLDTTWP